VKRSGEGRAEYTNNTPLSRGGPSLYTPFASSAGDHCSLLASRALPLLLCSLPVPAVPSNEHNEEVLSAVRESQAASGSMLTKTTHFVHYIGQSLPEVCRKVARARACGASYSCDPACNVLTLSKFYVLANACGRRCPVRKRKQKLLTRDRWDLFRNNH
jgi:hypothetical protein